MWPLFVTLLVPLTVLSVIIFVPFFLILYPILTLGVSSFLGPIGAVTAFATVLQLLSKATAVVMKITYFPKLQGAVFTSVLERQGFHELEMRRRMSQKRSTNDVALILNDFNGFVKCRTIPFLSSEIMSIACGFVPILGPCLSIYIRAPHKARRFHKKYFLLIEADMYQTRKFYQRHKAEYLSFGAVAICLEMIPFALVFFMFTSNIGMALWAADHHPEFSRQAIQ